MTATAEYVFIGWGHQDATGTWFFHQDKTNHLGCVPVYIERIRVATLNPFAGVPDA